MTSRTVHPAVWTVRKWRALFSIWLQDALAYRASAVIWICTDLVTAVTMPLVFIAAARGGDIRGMVAGDFVLYYLCMLLVTSFVSSHIMWEIAMEIKEGQFSTQLMRPVSFLAQAFFRSLSWRVMRTALFAPIFGLLLLAYASQLQGARVYLGWEFWTSLVLGHMVSFTFVTMMAMLALFVEETTTIFELYYFPMLFLSGQIFPVSLLPDWARSAAIVFPFYYTTAAPTEILIGRLSGQEALQSLGIQLLWIAGCYVVGKVLWHRGLRFYNGVGM